jgi:hypothetical protein
MLTAPGERRGLPGIDTREADRLAIAAPGIRVAHGEDGADQEVRRHHSAPSLDWRVTRRNAALTAGRTM